MKAEPHPYLSVGGLVRITTGPLAGREGISGFWSPVDSTGVLTPDLVRRKGNLGVVLSVDLIQRSIVVDADAFLLEPIARPARLAYPSRLDESRDKPGN